MAPSERQQLFAIPMGEGNNSAIFRPYQAAMAAWAETCPVDEATSLFDWPDLRDQHWPDVPYWSAGPLVDEYAARVHDARILVSEMTAALARLVDEIEPKVRIDFTRSGLARTILQQIFSDLAPMFPPPASPMPQDPQSWFDWLQAELAGAGYQVLTNLYERLYPRQRLQPFAIAFWVQRYDSNTWERLIHDFYILEELNPYRVIQHMGTIVPPDQMAAWKPALSIEQRGNEPIVAFCQWLQPEYRDVLALYARIRRPYDDVAACAYQAYLHKTPRVVLEELWDWHQDLPLWQLLTLDRYLFAPQLVKPMPVVWDVQRVEADLRREDPLNGRGL
ncbi:MAG: hypothetical protein M3P51_14870 [Chloroflexota bacterium]|nr:hypothetical protein [Chloroflexota bacterium]